MQPATPCLQQTWDAEGVPALLARLIRCTPTDPLGSLMDKLAAQGNMRQIAPPMRTAASDAAQLRAPTT